MATGDMAQFFGVRSSKMVTSSELALSYLQRRMFLAKCCREKGGMGGGAVANAGCIFRHCCQLILSKKNKENKNVVLELESSNGGSGRGPNKNSFSVLLVFGFR
jgi:hypothetical protein